MVLACAVASGCFYPASRGKLVEQRLDQLDEEKKELTASLEAQRQRLDSEVSAKIAEVQKAMEMLDKSARRSGADMGIQLEQLQNDVNVLRGQVEQYLFRIEQVEQALLKLKAGEEARAAEEKEAKERPADKKAFADLVSAKLAEGKTALGRQLAHEWLRKWPKDPLAARVHFELGASHQADREWRAALAEYAEIVKSFPKSDRAPEALLRSAECFQALKMGQEAKLALEEILASYPKSPAAKTAKTRLAKLRKGSGKK
jgi:TolA-binding protein